MAVTTSAIWTLVTKAGTNSRCRRMFRYQCSEYAPGGLTVYCSAPKDRTNTSAVGATRRRMASARVASTAAVQAWPSARAGAERRLSSAVPHEPAARIHDGEAHGQGHHRDRGPQGHIVDEEDLIVDDGRDHAHRAAAQDERGGERGDREREGQRRRPEYAGHGEGQRDGQKGAGGIGAQVLGRF